jgi:hypothetical protein
MATLDGRLPALLKRAVLLLLARAGVTVSGALPQAVDAHTSQTSAPLRKPVSLPWLQTVCVLGASQWLCVVEVSTRQLYGFGQFYL